MHNSVSISLLKNWLPALLIAVSGSFAIAQEGIVTALILLGLPFGLLSLILAFRQPQYFLYTALIMSYLISLLSRYIPGGIPFGLSIDGLLLLSLLALVFKKSAFWKPQYINNTYSLMLLIWLVFTIGILFNPSGTGLIPWFYANRGLSIYPLLFAILSMYLLKKEKHLNTFLLIWAVFALFGTLWGVKQLLFGVSQVEQQWLNAGAASTHILFGKLRVFSFYSDSAQYAANQAHTAVVFGVIGLFTGKLKNRIIYLIVALLALYGMIISGTRGVLAVLALGGFTYLIMTKNFKIILLGVLIGLGAFVFLKYTTIAQSNYQVNRMRSALNSEDASLQVRQDRIQVLKGYLADKPLGGGIGSAGYWGKRFFTGSFLGEIGTDGHYTRIWMETGIIGLYLYIAMLLIIMFYLGKLLWNMKESRIKQILVGFLCGFVGLTAASYTNGLMVQLPTGPLLFSSLALIYNFRKQ